MKSFDQCFFILLDRTHRKLTTIVTVRMIIIDLLLLAFEMVIIVGLVMFGYYVGRKTRFGCALRERELGELGIILYHDGDNQVVRKAFNEI